MDDDDKRYTIFEPILQKVNQKHVALPKNEKTRNSKILQVIDKIIQMVREKSILFDSLYRNKFYGGSYYDDLKVGNPTEYDIDCILSLPKMAESKVVVSDEAGYVHVLLQNLAAFQKKTDEAIKYVGLDKLLEGNHLCTKKVKAWMEGLFSSVIGENAKTGITIDDKKCIVKYRMVKNGPALTIKLKGEHEGQLFNLDIDLVPCFTFSGEHWPKKKFRANPSKSKHDTFFVVPKSPSDNQNLYWRLSFQEQERELLNASQVIKPALRLLKKVRDRHQHKIASYYIKTVFLWEMEKIDDNLKNKSLSFVFIMMLSRYLEYLEKKTIPYYWNSAYNLIGDLPEEIISPIADRIKNIVVAIDKMCNPNDCYKIVQFFACDERDLEKFKQEVPLSKKFQKKTDCTKAIQQVVPQSNLSNSLLVAIAEDLKRISKIQEDILEKVTLCENEIKDLKLEFDEDRLHNRIMFGEIQRKINSVSQKTTLGTKDLLGRKRHSI